MAMIKKESFGKFSDGREVFAYTLRNTKGTEAVVIDYGARLASWRIRDGEYRPVDVVLGYGDAAGYEKDTARMGATMGRYANRIGGASFTLDGKRYELDKNHGKDKQHHIHGGFASFDKQFWKGEETPEGVRFTYTSPDGEGGYPGTLRATVIYSLSNDNELSIRYEATSDADTVCNLTNHTYFNLDGFASGSVLDQKIQIFADTYTWANEESLPDGRILPVEGTPLDLRQLTPIGAHIGDDFDQLRNAGGYDHNFCIREEKPEIEMELGMFGFDPGCPIDYNEGGLKKAAYAEGATSGITLTTYTTMPGLQFYTGNSLKGFPEGKDGVSFPPRTGFCLETQFYPDAPNHPEFPQPILRKGETWKGQTVYVLKLKK